MSIRKVLIDELMNEASDGVEIFGEDGLLSPYPIYLPSTNMVREYLVNCESPSVDTMLRL